jgi:hypothetical protein
MSSVDYELVDGAVLARYSAVVDTLYAQSRSEVASAQ